MVTSISDFMFTALKTHYLQIECIQLPCLHAKVELYGHLLLMRYCPPLMMVWEQRSVIFFYLPADNYLAILSSIYMPSLTPK